MDLKAYTITLPLLPRQSLLDSHVLQEQAEEFILS